MDLYETSNYVIYTQMNNDMFVLIHGYTGAIDLVNNNVVQALLSNSFNKLQDTTLKLLLSRGYITNLSLEEETSKITSAIDKLSKAKEKASKNFVIVITYNCNLNCIYCYQHNLKKMGKDFLYKNISVEQVNKIFKIIEEIKTNKEKSINITLYGGEPLLKKNREIVGLIVNKAEGKGFYVNAISNGVNLLEFSYLLKSQKIRSIQITLDGIQEIHNKRRPAISNSFNKIIKGIEKTLENDVKINIRMNVDKTNIRYIKDLILFFENKGWFKKENFSFIPSHIMCNDSKIKVNDLDIFNEIRQIAKISKKFIKSYFSLYKSQSDFSVISNFKDVYCGAMRNMFIFDPFENIYPCLGIVGLKDFAIGTYKDKFKLNENITMWQERTIKNIPKCLECPYALFCAGNCPVRALEENGNMYLPMCGDFKEMFKEAIKENFMDISNQY